MSPLAAQIDRFLRFKRTLGCRYLDEERALHVLDRFLVSRLSSSDPLITDGIIRSYVARWGNESDSTRGHRLSLIREFCRFLATEDPRTPVSPTHMFAIRRPSFVPRVLTLADAARFLKACESLPPGWCSPLRGVVHGTLLILLYLTGMRVGEALALTVGDVDITNQLLHIRKAKFGKERLVPIAPDLAERLRLCQQEIGQRFKARSRESAFFPGPKGAPCTIGSLRDSFWKALKTAGIDCGGSNQRIRLHDL
jgi:integrase